MGSRLHTNPLSKASELVRELGSEAEMRAGEQIEAALARQSEEDFRYWSMVAKAIVLLTRQPADTNTSKEEPIASLPPAETLMIAARRASR